MGVHRWPGVAFDILKLNSDWLWSVDPTGILTEWSPASQLQLAVPQRRNQWGHWRQYLCDDKDLRTNLSIMLRQVRDRAPFRCIKIGCRLPELQTRSCLRLSGVPMYDENGTYLGYRGVAQNQTSAMMVERKLDRLTRQNRKLLTAIEASPLNVMIADSGRSGLPISYANPALTMLTGYLRAEVLGADALFLAGPETDIADLTRIEDAIVAQRPLTLTLRLHRKDGSAFWGEMVLLPTLDDDYRQRAVVIMLRDVTTEREQRRAEQQQDRLHTLGQLAGSMAHEINNLLQPALLYSELLDDVLEGDMQGREFVHGVREPLDQIQFIVRNTLRFSRHEGNREARQKVPFGRLVRERVAYVRGLMPPGLVISIEGVGTIAGCASVGPTELTQVLSNLLQNAAHAMGGRGEVRVCLSALHVDGVQVRPAGMMLGEYFQLEVIDTGPGMPPDVLARVFEPFFTTKAVGEGTGLGLSVVYGIVADWGGSIHARSEPGSGTTFTILIPRLREPGDCSEAT